MVYWPRTNETWENELVVVKQKEVVQATTRSVNSVCTSGVRCDVTALDHTIVTDKPAERHGGNEVAPTLLHLNSALATCQTVQIHKVAKAKRFSHGIEASTTTDRVTGNGDDKVMRFSAAELNIEIETDETPEHLERLKTLSENAYPMGILFSDAGFTPVINWTTPPMKG